MSKFNKVSLAITWWLPEACWVAFAACCIGAVITLCGCGKGAPSEGDLGGVGRPMHDTNVPPFSTLVLSPPPVDYVTHCIDFGVIVLYDSRHDCDYMEIGGAVFCWRGSNLLAYTSSK